MSNYNEFLDKSVEFPKRWTADIDGTPVLIEDLERDTGQVFEQGTVNDAEKFNQIQENCVYSVGSSFAQTTVSEYTALNFNITGQFAPFLGFKVSMEAGASNQGESVLIIAGFTVGIRKKVNGVVTQLDANDIINGEYVELEHDGVFFIVKNIRNVCPFPIGSGYMSFDTTDPSTLWNGTTWQQVPTGLYLKTDTNPELTGGSNSITQDNLPNVSPTFTGNVLPTHSHERGTMEITGSFGGSIDSDYYTTGAFDQSSTGSVRGIQASTTGRLPINFTASDTWTGSTEEVSGGTPSGTISPLGNGQDFDLPFITVVMWKRLT